MKKYKLKDWVKRLIFGILALILILIYISVMITILKPKEVPYTNETHRIELAGTGNQVTLYEPINSVYQLSEKYTIEYELLESIIRWETGNRTSNAYKEYNNSCGMMYKGKLIHFETKYKGEEACARNLKENYIDQGLDTIQEIQKKYAPVGVNDKGSVNQYWVKGVTTIYNGLN